MGFLYIDITGTDANSGQYEVFNGNIKIGQVIKQGHTFYARKPESNNYLSQTFKNTEEAAKYLSELAGIDWQKK